MGIIDQTSTILNIVIMQAKWLRHGIAKKEVDMGLYGYLLKRLQEVNTYGGGASIHHLHREVCDAIDSGIASNDLTLISLDAELRKRASHWRQPEDFEARSHFFETYCEATFYLASSARGLHLKAIPLITGKKTADFTTLSSPQIHFEIKTLDIANPSFEYSQQMNDGLEANIEAHEKAKKRGIGSSMREISQHGNANTWLDVMYQTMKKLSGNIKREQYTETPTFLVANMSRLSINVDVKHLAPSHYIPVSDTFENEGAKVSGQLWTIANHIACNSFTWHNEDGCIKSQILTRAGLLKDFDFLQGIIFTSEPWGVTGTPYLFLGIWNRNCSLKFSAEEQSKARDTFNLLCTRTS